MNWHDGFTVATPIITVIVSLLLLIVMVLLHIKLRNEFEAVKTSVDNLTSRSSAVQPAKKANADDRRPSSSADVRANDQRVEQLNGTINELQTENKKLETENNELRNKLRKLENRPPNSPQPDVSTGATEPDAGQPAGAEAQEPRPRRTESPAEGEGRDPKRTP
jgi:TolA-binding protein